MITIHRQKLSANYTILPNDLLRDKRLSFKSRGILAMMLSLPNDWKSHASWIQEQGTEGREALHGAFRELEQFNYLKRTQQKCEETGKILPSIWEWQDNPSSNGFPDAATHQREAVLREAISGNQHVLSTEKEAPKEEKNKNQLIEQDDFYPLPFQQFWKLYPRKKSKGQALKAFKALKGVTNDMLLSGLRVALESPDWLKDNGQFIPHPATWLNARGWEDGEEIERADIKQPQVKFADPIKDNPNFMEFQEWFEKLPPEPESTIDVDFNKVLQSYRENNSPDASISHTDGPQSVEEVSVW
jgi:hypothetical protein